MPTMTRPPEVPDWTADPRLTRLAERRAELDRQASQVRAQLAKADDDARLAAETYQSAEAEYLVGTAPDRRAVDVARTRAESATAAVDQARRLVAESTSQLARFDEIKRDAEAQARADASQAFRATYDPAVRDLADALEAAHAANVRVNVLHTEARRNGITSPALVFGPLLANGDPGTGMASPGSGELRHWLDRLHASGIK